MGYWVLNLSLQSWCVRSFTEQPGTWPGIASGNCEFQTIGGVYLEVSSHAEQRTGWCITIFITKVHLFKKFCESLFPWLEKCLNYCIKNNLCKGYNTRLPAFLMERYASYWFSVNTKKKYLSYARLGKFMLSNNINKYMNPVKIPLTFRMYPTLHDF